MALRKPSDLFDKKVEENKLPEVEDDNTLRKELNKVESLSEQLNQLQQELTQKVVKNDLETLVLSEINRMRENFEVLQNELQESNESDFVRFNDTIIELSKIVNNLVETEIPNYKKRITKNELIVNEKVNQFQQSVDQSIKEIREEIGDKFDDIADVVDNNIEYFNQQLLETSSQVKKTTETYTNLSKIFENKISKENQQLEEYSQIIENIQTGFIELQESLNRKVLENQNIVEEKIETLQIKNQKQFEDIQLDIESSIDNFVETYHKDIADVKADVVINEQHVKNVDKYLQEYHRNLIELKEEVFGEIEKLSVGNLQENLERLERKIDFIKKTYSNIEPEVIVKEVISEGLLNEPAETKNKDPLTPLNQNFVTLDQLQQHYRLFINRIQQQLSTLGGGGETQLKYLDDVVGIATNPSAYDGKYLKYNHSIGKFEFETVSGGPGGSQSLDEVLQIGNISNLGMSVGVVTATQFDGYLVGSATYAATAGVATALQTSRTFEITGDIIASPISFDGTGNVSFAATIQPNSVGLGTDTTGDYVQSIIGTANEITVTGGTGEGSTPVISISPNPLLPGNVTIANDLQVNRNLNVTGNITIGGTSAYIISNDFRVKDADIVLGFTTDSYGNDASNDTTANHGGIAVASTEGTPLVQLYNVAIGEINPATYKKIMWFKSGAFAGLNTDAWLINYAVGIGSTQIPNGVRLAAGNVQITEYDISKVRNINASGIVTATAYYGDGSNLSNIISGVAVRKDDVVVGTAATAFNFTGAGVSSITVSSGIATINIPAPQKTTVYYTATEGQTTFTANYTVGYIDVYLNGVKLSQAEFTANTGTSVILSTGVSSGDIVELTGYTTFNVSSSYASNAGVATYALVSGYASNSGFATNSQLADVATVANTLISTANVNTIGIITANAFYGSGSNLSGIVTNITAGDNITVSSSSGNITISASGGGGNWVSSGTTKVYTTSSVGIGILNPSYNLDVFGNINFTGTLFQNGTPFSGSKWIGEGLPTDPIYRLSNVGVGLTNPIARLGTTSFTLGNVGHSTSGIVTTTTATANQVLDSMPTATFRSARYQVSIACTGQLVGSATSSSTVSISGITSGTFYIPGTYTNVPLISTSGSDAIANITVVGTTKNVGFTTTGNLLVVTAPPSGIGTDQPITLALNVPNDTLTGTALTAGTIYYATGIGTTAFTVSYTSGGAAVAIGTTSFAGVGNTVTISGGVSVVSIISPGSGYGIGVTLTAAASNLGTVGSGFTCAIRNVVSNYQTSDLMILQSVGSASTSCDYIEYASLANNEILGTFGADISGVNARLLFSPTYRNNTIKIVRHSIVI